jgi:hypothetical protein
VQRLFSMFPAGGPGIALLVLRISVSSMLFLGLMPQGWELVTLIALLGLICCGFVTPAACLVTAVFVGFHLPPVVDLHTVDLGLLIPITLALAVLGPGAFSIDSKLFGRKLISPGPEGLAIDVELKRR